MDIDLENESEKERGARIEEKQKREFVPLVS